MGKELEGNEQMGGESQVNRSLQCGLIDWLQCTGLKGTKLNSRGKTQQDCHGFFFIWALTNKVVNTTKEKITVEK